MNHFTPSPCFCGGHRSISAPLENIPCPACNTRSLVALSRVASPKAPAPPVVPAWLALGSARPFETRECEYHGKQQMEMSVCPRCAEEVVNAGAPFRSVNAIMAGNLA